MTVAAHEGIRVRAIGDSVTAGFGYYEEGSLMELEDLFVCKPSESNDDACSSNSSNRENMAPLAFAPDYGLANNVSWAAQWANEYGVSDYKNLAVSGSEPSNWLPGGSLYELTEEVEAEDPDYILMTIGANPLLSNLLFGLDNMGCAIWADIVEDFPECVEENFAEVHLRQNLEAVYRELLEKTSAKIYISGYHLSIPSISLAYSANQIAKMDSMLNEEIEAASLAVDPVRARLESFEPPHFNVGIELETWPATYTCSFFDSSSTGPACRRSRPRTCSTTPIPSPSAKGRAKARPG